MRQWLALCGICVFSILMSGCGQKEDGPPPTAEATPVVEKEEERRARQRATRIETFTEGDSDQRRPAGSRRATSMSSPGSGGAGSASRSIGGQVTDMAGEPIANAHVEVLTPPYQALAATAQRDGEFAFEKFPGTTVTLRASAPSYRALNKVAGPDRSRVNFVLQKRQVVNLQAVVVDDQTSQPVATATLTPVEGALGDVKQESGGTFAVPVEAGTIVRLKVEAPGYLPYDTGRVRVPADDTVAQMVLPLGKGGYVTGQVLRRGLDKEPMAGVKVAVLPRDENGIPIDGKPLATATTNIEGQFTLSLVPSGPWVVMARTEAPITTGSKVVTVATAQTADAGTILLGEVQMGSIDGRVLRLPERKGVEGLEVLLRRSTGQRTTTTTGPNGEFSFGSIAQGQMGVYVPEYHLYTWIMILEGEPTKKLELFVGAGRLEGKVLRNGEPVLADCRITQAGQACDQKKRTGPDGSFLFDGLAPGAWTVTVAPISLPHLGRDFPVEILEDGPTQATFNLPTGTLKGIVVDAEDKPVAGAVASVSWLPKGQASTRLEARTQADGTFEIHDLDAGTFDVVVNHSEKGVGKTRGVAVPETGESALCTVKLVSKGGTLVSTALNFATGAPVPEAWCHLYPEEGGFYKHNAKRGPDGVLTLAQLPPGKYRTQVSYFSLSINDQQVEIKDGQTAHIEDVLHPAGALNVLVLDRHGNPIANAEITLKPETRTSIETDRQATTDEKGAATVRGLMAGRYTVTARAGTGSASDTVGITIGGVSAVQLRLK